jgi:hypothetical protein
MGLLLEAVDVTGPLRWRWLLRDEETGASLADHQVDLDPSAPEVDQIGDLYRYSYSFAAPDRRPAEGARLVSAMGDWAGRELLGADIGAAIVAESPVTVRVSVPAELGRVLLWPLELAHAGGTPLAARGDVTLVYDIAPGTRAPRKDQVGDTLRMLAVFSQPTKTSVLALRRERYELTRLIRRIAARQHAVVELQVVQYGVTRDRLAEIADSGEGWDLLHLSGHGTGGAFLLEKKDGAPDPVSPADLVTLLRPARRRLKLAVVSACESAADTTAQTLRLLGLTEQAQALEAQEAAGHAATQVPGLTRALVRDLGCAVVGMRYPVVDEFAIAFGEALYDNLLSQAHKHTVDVAVARAAAAAAGAAPSDARPALSLATPGVFGVQAAGLRLRVPRGAPRLDPAAERMAYFPDEPPRFVGRAEAMARAGAALAPDGGKSTVLLHGMAGAGKTACALELAYRHQDAFAAAAFWQAPTKPEQWPGALADFANRLDIQLGGYGFTMASNIATVAALEAFLPRLRSLLARAGVLLVLDNLETLLSEDGTWRDPRWTPLLSALTSHDGESRLILTSRVVPAGLDRSAGSAGSRILALPVHALSRDESAVLARELPHLRALLHADGGPVRVDPAGEAAQGPKTAHDSRSDEDAETAQDSSATEEATMIEASETREVSGAAESLRIVKEAEAEQRRVAADRDRVVRVLRVVQGHPKLLELADAAAADRDRLDAQLAAAEAAVAASSSPSRLVVPQLSAAEATASRPAGGELDAFFRDGRTDLNATQFLDALTLWTTAAVRVLSPPAALMAQFVACLEDGDRRSDVIEDNWAHLWRRLDRPGDPPGSGPLLAALTRAAIVEAEPIAVAGAAAHLAPATGNAPVGGQASDIQVESDTRPGPVAYRMHPGVATTVTTAAGPDVRAAVDTELAAYWGGVSRWVRERESGEDSGLVVHAGLSAAPYLLRREEWDVAAFLLEQSVMRDGTPGTVHAVLPALRRIAVATGALKDAGRLARSLAGVDAEEAERRLRAVKDAGAESGDYLVASGASGDLINLLLDRGRPAEALAVAGEMAEYTRRARVGPWTRLAGRERRLQVLVLMGEHGQVLAGVEELRGAMALLPVRSDATETVSPWNVREAILSTGYSSALATKEWERCLELNTEIVTSKRQRGAGVHDITRIRYNDAGPLIRLGRQREAARLLAECQRVFEDHADITGLARVLSTRADLEDKLGHQRMAAELEQTSLRLCYARPVLPGVAIGHNNLALYLGRLGADPAEQRAHGLAAALIYRLAGMAHDLADTVHALATELRAGGGADDSLPSTVAQVVAAAERTEGVHLAALLAALQPDPAVVEAALAEILQAAATLPPEDYRPDPAALLEQWQPVIAVIAAACQPGQTAPPELLRFLDRQAKVPSWGVLVAALRRILAGERDEPALLGGLDPIHTVIVRETLDRLAAPATQAPEAPAIADLDTGSR